MPAALRSAAVPPPTALRTDADQLRKDLGVELDAAAVRIAGYRTQAAALRQRLDEDPSTETTISICEGMCNYLDHDCSTTDAMR